MKPGNRAPRSLDAVSVDTFTNGLLDPRAPMLGPVRSGGCITVSTSPACWGPMITPTIRGGHEVSQPVAVEGAEIGDSVLIRIRDITVHSLAAASGVHEVIPGRNAGNPFALARCPQCGTVWPDTILRGTGEGAVRCAHCGADASPFKVAHGYTMVFDAGQELGITLSSEAAARIAAEAARYAALPARSATHPFLVMAPAHLPGVAARLRPFLGNLGTLPGVRIPAANNAGDAALSLVEAPHEYGIKPSDLPQLTDGHMDCDAVQTGALVLCPVRVPGAGVYAGDMHALQGDGEIAGHTVDVSGTATLQVELIKGLALEGPVLFPLPRDLPFLAQPLSPAERSKARALAREWDMPDVELSAPISVIGTGATINEATANGLQRAAKLLSMSVEETRNRATITGAIEIARLQGVVQVTFLVPLARLRAIGLGTHVQEQYGITAS